MAIIKTAAVFICSSFEFVKRILDKASIFTAELEAIVSVLRYSWCRYDLG